MKKILKITTFIILCFAIICAGFALYCFVVASGAKLDESKLINGENKIIYYDYNGAVLKEDCNGIDYTDIGEMPDYVPKAFIAIEDKRFLSHDGVDSRSILRAFFNNIFSLSFKEGASTITQQLIKNTHFNGEKTLKRKISEIKLAKEIEKKYSKTQIMEKYLNTIYFGNNSYGISSAAKNYFDKTPDKLSVSEAATLAGIIKAPSKYSPILYPEKCLKRRNTVLKEMFSQGYIGENDYNSALSDSLTIKNNSRFYDYTYLAEKQVEKILGDKLKYRSDYKVYTYSDSNLQSIVENINTDIENKYDYSAVLTDNKSHIKAYVSTVGEMKRQIGSTIKPILVYAPAIEYNVISPLTPILDEKTDFNGYTPKNYGDKYYGYVSAKYALAKSLNVCSVKILNSTGIEKSKNFARKAGLNFTEKDKYLNIALGSTEKGETLTDLVGAYNVFSNNGNHINPTCIYKITDKNGKTVYMNKENKTKVCSPETAYLINDMLKETVLSGTAKLLKNTEYSLCAKTGTVGNENGNSDALTVSYTPDLTLGVWVGKADGKLMDNSVTGGSIPAKESDIIWKKINEKFKINDFTMPDGIKEIYIDKISYEKENKLIIADENAPLRFKMKALFKKNNLPKEKSSRFIMPEVLDSKISVFNEGILIKLCLTELCEAKIYRQFNGKKTLVYDTLNNDKTFFDFDATKSGIYTYSVIPYYKFANEISYGKEIYLEKIALSNETGDWWLKLI